MTTLQTLRPWTGAIVAFFVMFAASGRASAAAAIAFSLPMCIFFVCAVAYSAQKQIASLQAQVDELRRWIKSNSEDAH